MGVPSKKWTAIEEKSCKSLQKFCSLNERLYASLCQNGSEDICISARYVSVVDNSGRDKSRFRENSRLPPQLLSRQQANWSITDLLCLLLQRHTEYEQVQSCKSESKLVLPHLLDHRTRALHSRSAVMQRGRYAQATDSYVVESQSKW